MTPDWDEDEEELEAAPAPAAATLAPEAANASPETLIVPPDGGGGRLDRATALLWPDLSRSAAKRIIEEGGVAVNGAILCDPSAKVKPGAPLTLTRPALRPSLLTPEPMDLAVIHEDDRLIIIDKPPGVVVHPAPGSPAGTLVNGLLAHCGDSLRGVGGVARPGVVHRIDKDTSGLLVFAKDQAAHAMLSAQFADHSIERLYRAWIWGAPVPASASVDAPLGRHPVDRTRMAIVQKGGKRAVTHYRAVALYAGGAAAQIECRLETGRTHQIRVHLASRGHALIGDPVYGRADSRRRGPHAAAIAALADRLGRQALHAAELGFRHPDDGRMVRFTAEAPEDLCALKRELELL